MIVFGLLFLVVGLGVGYLMYTHPEGLNPSWPLGMAMLAPALFVLGGLHVVAQGLGHPRISILMLRAILVSFGVLIHWAAFFTSNFQCTVTISFLGSSVLGWQPSEMECRYSLRVLIAVIDLLIVAVIGVFAWQRYRGTGKEHRA